MDGQKKIRLHSMSDPDWEKITGIAWYEHRPLISSNNHDVVIVSRGVDNQYLEYRNEFLGIKSKILVCEGHGNNLAQMAMNDSVLLRVIQSLCANGNYVLDTFVVGKDEEALSRKLNVAILGNAESTKNFGSKSGFRVLAQHSNVKVAPGFEHVYSENKALENVGELFNFGYQSVVVKGDWGASSAQNLVVDRTEDWQNRVIQFYSDNHLTSCVVEAWLPNVESSPSIHYYLNGHGVMPLTGPWKQILVGKNQVYAGTLFPATEKASVIELMKEQGRRLADMYYACGYRGYLGFDSMELSDGSLAWAECNARKGGPYYPMAFAKMMNVDNNVVWGRDLASPSLKGNSFGRLVEICHDLLFNRGHKQGIAFYNSGLLEFGKIQTIIVADSHNQADEYWSELNRRIGYLFSEEHKGGTHG